MVVGGVLGYARKGSVLSLAGGAGAGLLLLLAGFISLKAFEKRRKSFVALILETGNKSKRSLLGSSSLLHFSFCRLMIDIHLGRHGFCEVEEDLDVGGLWMHKGKGWLKGMRILQVFRNI